MKKKKETRGGTRKNAGAKPKYSEQSKTFANSKNAEKWAKKILN